jgi:hypothetical protein
MWCAEVFVPVHATHALCHVLREGHEVKQCKQAMIPVNYLCQYQELKDSGENCAVSKKCGVETVDGIVVEQQATYVMTMLSQKHGKLLEVYDDLSLDHILNHTHLFIS